MTFTTGYMHAPKELREYVRKIATNNFFTVVELTDREYGGCIPYPSLEGFSPINSKSAPVALHGPNFPPHTDPKIIDTSSKDTVWKAFFWVVDTSSSEDTQEKSHGVHLQVENESIYLRKYQWVVFDATKMHSAQSSSKWFGISAQIICTT